MATSGPTGSTRPRARTRACTCWEAGRRYLTARYISPTRRRYASSSRDGEEGGASEFVAVWEPYVGERFVERVERLPVEGDGAGPFRPVGVRVTLAGGQVDTFIYTSDPAAEVECGGIRLQGRFGYYSEQDGKPRCLHLVDGKRLGRGALGIEDPAGPFVTNVAAVGLTDHWLTLDAPMPSEARLPGRVLYLAGGKHRTAYHLADVSEAGDRVGLTLTAYCSGPGRERR